MSAIGDDVFCKRKGESKKAEREERTGRDREGEREKQTETDRHRTDVMLCCILAMFSCYLQAPTCVFQVIAVVGSLLLLGQASGSQCLQCTRAAVLLYAMSRDFAFETKHNALVWLQIEHIQLCFKSSFFIKLESSISSCAKSECV